MSIHTNYLTSVLDLNHFRKGISAAKKALKPIEFDAFAVTGNSGTLFGGALALAMKKKLILVRKPSDNSHSTYSVEGDDAIQRYVFLDDQVSTGATKTRVEREMKAWLSKVEFVGTYLYNNSGYWAYNPNYVVPPTKKKRKPRAKSKAPVAKKKRAANSANAR